MADVRRRRGTGLGSPRQNTREGEVFRQDVERMFDKHSKQLDASFVTVEDEAIDLPKSRVLTAGTNITIDDDGPGGAVTISAAGGGGGGAPTDATYVTLSLNGTLTAERVLTAGTGITVTDGGANGPVTVATTITQYTNEMAQDAVGGALVDSSSVDFTYNDGANTITAAVIAAGVDHGGLGGLADDDHTQYILVTGSRAFSGAWTVNAASPTCVMGDGTGSPALRLDKSDAGLCEVLFRSNGVDRANVRLNSTENLQFIMRDAAGTSTGAVTITSADGEVQFPSRTRHGGSSGSITASGTGSPEGVVTAPVGSQFRRTDGGTGTSHYFKETGAGNTGWVAVGGADAEFIRDTVAAFVVAGTNMTITHNDGADTLTFDASAGGGSLTVEEVDGAPSVAAVATLRFDQADGFVVSTPGAGIARVDLGSNSVPGDRIADNGITNGKLRDSGALSVIGRSVNSAGDPADISVTGGTGLVLREDGVGGLGFGQVNGLVALVNDSVGDAQLRESAALSVIGRSANSVGNPADIVAGTLGHVLHRTATPTVAFGTLLAGAFATGPGIVTPSMLDNGTARSILGVAGNAAAARADVQSSAADQVPFSTATSWAWTSLRTAVRNAVDTIYELDFTAQANNTFVNGTETIDGLSWTAGSVAAATRTTFDILNGTGLRWTAPTSGATNVFTDATQSAAHIYLPLSQLSTWSDDFAWIIVEVYTTTRTLETGNNFFKVVLWRPAAVPHASSAVRSRGVAAAGNTPVMSTHIDGADANNSISLSGRSVMGFHLEQNGFLRALSGTTYAGSWPALRPDRLVSTGIGTGDISPLINGDTRLTFAFPQVLDASPTGAITIARMRIRAGY